MEEVEEIIQLKIIKLKDQYIDLDESGFVHIKKTVGEKIKKLNKCLEILNS